MSQQMYTITDWNCHESIYLSLHNGGNKYISTGNLTGIKRITNKYPSVLFRCTWKLFRVQGNASLRIVYPYYNVQTAQWGGHGSVYVQHLTNLSNNNKIIWLKKSLMSNISDQITTWTNVVFMLVPATRAWGFSESLGVVIPTSDI